MRGSSELSLRRQSFEVLRYLAEHAGKVVSSDELVQAVWASKPADHTSSVAQCIKEIRRALGEARWIIATVSGRGYEFKAEVEPINPLQSGVAGSERQVPSNRPSEGDGQAPDALASSNAPLSAVARPEVTSDTFRWRRLMFAAGIVGLSLVAAAWLLRPHPSAVAPNTLTMLASPTIAVLSFTGVASGLADELRSALTARAHQGFGLTVKSAAAVRDRAFVPKEDGPRLGIRYAVLGATSWDHDAQRANIQLLELETETLVWSESFDTRPGESGALEQLAARVARLITLLVLDLV
jgi:DNA-binding winged helix-turn-helix (wHTH) protein/TolB-like protein